MSEELKIEIPEDTLTISLRSGEKELFMSAGLIREIAAYVDTVDKFLGLWADPIQQAFLMALVLVPRDEKGKPQDETYNIEQAGLGANESRKLLKWIEDHVLYFFIENAETAKRSMNGPAIQKLTQLLSGSQGSQEQKLSAGDTTVTTETV